MTTENTATLPAVQKPKHGGAIMPLGINDFEPKNFAELKTLCIDLAKSEIIPKEYINKPANILIAVTFGRELGMRWAHSLQCIAVINGRPSMWGDDVGAMVKNSDVFEAERDEFDPAKDGGTAYFHAKRKGQTWIVRSFSHEDAKRADLLSKDTYKKYEKRMLFNRARAWAYRDAFQDVLKGMRIREEEQDFVETTAEKVYEDAPRRASAVAAAPAAPADPAPQPAAETAGSEPKKTSVKFDKVQKLTGEARWRAIGKDGVDYMMGIEEYSKAALLAIKHDVAADVEYEDGIGCREVFTLAVQVPKSE